jgi:hypothetical protein
MDETAHVHSGSRRRGDVAAADARAQTEAMIKSIEQGKWFLTVNCAYCGETIRIAEVPSLKSYPYFMYRTATDLKCPLCQHIDTYAPSLMRRRPESEKP